jgi:hypothetical protein
VGKGLLVGLFDDLDFHCVFSSGFGLWRSESGLLAGFGHLFHDPRATAVGKGLLVGFFDDLDFHGRFLSGVG